MPAKSENISLNNSFEMNTSVNFKESINQKKTRNNLSRSPMNKSQYLVISKDHLENFDSSDCNSSGKKSHGYTPLPLLDKSDAFTFENKFNELNSRKTMMGKKNVKSMTRISNSKLEDRSSLVSRLSAK